LENAKTKVNIAFSGEIAAARNCSSFESYAAVRAGLKSR